MTIRHHPKEDTLLAYAAGTLTPALSAVIACHLTMCHACRAELRRMELIGGALLKREKGDALSAKTVQNAIARIETKSSFQPTPPQPHSYGPAGLLPSPIARYLGMQIDDIPWRRLADGVEQYEVRLPWRAGQLRLLRVQPGRKLLRHSHRGAELTLVVKGAFRDETGDYRAGEVADLDEDIEHRPCVMGEEECICMVASERPPRYASLKLRLLQPFLRI